MFRSIDYWTSMAVSISVYCTRCHIHGVVVDGLIQLQTASNAELRGMLIDLPPIIIAGDFLE